MGKYIITTSHFLSILEMVRTVNPSTTSCSRECHGHFALLVIFLGLGGPHRERLQDSAGFTLALPVSRFRVVEIRVVMGMAELAVLALTPAILIPWRKCVAKHSPYRKAAVN